MKDICNRNSVLDIIISELNRVSFKKGISEVNETFVSFFVHYKGHKNVKKK